MEKIHLQLFGIALILAGGFTMLGEGFRMLSIAMASGYSNGGYLGVLLGLAVSVLSVLWGLWGRFESDV